MDDDKFIFCLEAVDDVATDAVTDVILNLENLAIIHGIGSIYKSCDTIEGLEESLNALLYSDHQFKNYAIIYLVMPGEPNNICLNDYYYTLVEIAEIFEGRLKGKMLHFANAKILDLQPEEAQYFLDVTGALSISGYGAADTAVTSSLLDNAFFNLCDADDDVIQIVEELHKSHYLMCKMLDFRLYY